MKSSVKVVKEFSSPLIASGDYAAIIVRVLFLTMTFHSPISNEDDAV